MFESKVPKDTVVLIAQETMYKRLYTRGDEFLPERWIRGEALSKENPPFAFLPFGHGRRKCIGFRISVTEHAILLCKLVKKYKMSYHHEPMEMTNKVLNVPIHPLRVRLEKRM